MAIIGQSKNSTLYQKVTTEGTKYRDIKYSDVSDTEPLIVKELPDLDDKTGGAGFIPDVTREVTARIDDTARITKLLTKYQGIKWQGHNAALTAIQNELDSKRGRYVGQSTDPEGILGTLMNVGRGALKALDLDVVTLAQVAVAGTGEHFTAWQSRAYINDADTFGGAIGNVLAQLGLGSNNGSAAQSAITTGKVLINPDNINGRQLPDTDTTGLRGAWRPKDRNGNWIGNQPLTYDTDEGRHFTAEPGNTYGPASDTGDSYEAELQTLDQNSQLYVKAQGEGNFESGSIEGSNLLEVQKPRMTNPLYGEVPSSGDQGQVSWSLDNYTGSYLEKSEFQPGNRYTITKYAKAESSSLSPNDPESKGPWMSDGAQSLWADRSNSSKPGSSDGGANKSDQNTFRNRWTRGDASTRVDNGRIEMIPFYIRAICPNTGDTLYGKAPTGENGYLFFEANLDSYSDNYEANWQGTEYVGRADKFWNYNGFDRQISFSFKMVAHSKSHLRPIYNRLNGLLSMTTPTYGTQADGGSFMRGTLAEITIGDLLSQQLGFIKSVSLKWETDYMWETDTETIMVPHVLDVSVNFTPIHRFVPHTDLRYFQLVNSGSGNTDTFIVNHNVLYKK